MRRRNSQKCAKTEPSVSLGRFCPYGKGALPPILDVTMSHYQHNGTLYVLSTYRDLTELVSC